MCDSYIKAHKLENYPLASLLYEYRSAITNYSISLTAYDLVDDYVLFSEQDKVDYMTKCEKDTEDARLAMMNARSLYYTAVKVYDTMQVIMRDCESFSYSD